MSKFDRNEVRSVSSYHVEKQNRELRNGNKSVRRMSLEDVMELKDDEDFDYEFDEKSFDIR